MLSAGIQPKIGQTEHQGIELQTQIPPKSDRSPLTLADRKIIADVLTWDTQREVSASEVETIAIQHDIVWVKLTDNRAIPLHVETFRAIRRQQQEPREANSELEKAKASPAFVATQNVVKREPISQSAPAYSANPIGYRGAAANWKAFLASGRKLDISGDPMQKWRELERQQQATRVSTDVPVNCLNSQSQKEAA